MSKFHLFQFKWSRPGANTLIGQDDIYDDDTQDRRICEVIKQMEDLDLDSNFFWLVQMERRDKFHLIKKLLGSEYELVQCRNTKFLHSDLIQKQTILSRIGTTHQEDVIQGEPEIDIKRSHHS